MKRNAPKDPITPEVRAEVLERDHFRCVGPELADMAGIVPLPCKTRFGESMVGPYGYRTDELQMDHVRDERGRRISQPRWLQSGCPGCHLGGFLGRADIRTAARDRLAKLYGDLVLPRD